MRSWECKAPGTVVSAEIQSPGDGESSGEIETSSVVEPRSPFPMDVDCRKLVRSFRYAFAGAWHVLKTEQNMRLHVLLSLAVLVMGWYLGISGAEWGLVFLCIGVVMAAECFNSSVERLADRISQEEHFLIRVAKDASAGGVLMVSLSAAAAGLVIFLPKLWAKLVGG